MDDVELTLLRHVAGHYDPVLGQLCIRCGMVLDEGKPVGPAVGELLRLVATPQGWPPGEGVLASIGGGFRVQESALHPDRDRSDEANCASIAELTTTPEPDCECDHRFDQHTFAEEPGETGCWCCSCVAYVAAEDYG